MCEMKMVRLVLNGVVLACIALMAGCVKSGDPGLSFEEQLEVDLKAIDKYLADNNITAQVDPDNLIRYVVHEEGNGASPKISNCIMASYNGKFLNGTSFDKSNNAAIPLSGVILGWRVGVPLLNQGDSATLYLPSGLAYGPGGYATIPGNTNLLFHIRIKSIGTQYNAAANTCN